MEKNRTFSSSKRDNCFLCSQSSIKYIQGRGSYWLCCVEKHWSNIFIAVLEGRPKASYQTWQLQVVESKLIFCYLHKDERKKFHKWSHDHSNFYCKIDWKGMGGVGHWQRQAYMHCSTLDSQQGYQIGMLLSLMPNRCPYQQLRVSGMFLWSNRFIYVLKKPIFSKRALLSNCHGRKTSLRTKRNLCNGKILVKSYQLRGNKQS